MVGRGENVLECKKLYLRKSKIVDFGYVLKFQKSECMVGRGEDVLKCKKLY